MPERYFRDELTSGGRPAPDPNPGGRHPHPDPWCRACVAHGISLAYLEG